jgi:outer membrane lipoprotein-sorting protein
MFRRIHVLVVAALLLGFAVTFLMPSGVSAKDDISEFIKKAKEGYEKYQAEVKDETIVQEMKTAAPTGEITTYNTVYFMGARMRIESRMEMTSKSEDPDSERVMESVIVYDGADFWMATPATGKRKLTRREVQQYQTQRRLWDMMSSEATLVGSETLGEHDCHIVRLAGEGDEAGARLWMDKKSRVIVVVEEGSMRGHESRLVNSDFREVETGWEIPYKTQLYRGDRLLSTLVVKSREVNSNLAESLFDPEVLSVAQRRTEDVREMMQGQGGGGD